MAAMRMLLLITACVALSGCVFEVELEPGPPPPADTYCSSRDGGGDAMPCVVAGTCAAEAWVMDQVMIPSTSEESMRWALHFGDKKYNSLGGILALIASQLPQLDLPTWIYREILSGQALNLLRLRRHSGDLGQGAALKGQVTVAWPQKCCSDANQWPACGDEAKKTCFSGSHAFTVDQQSQWLPGSLKAAALSFGPGEVILALGLKGAAPVKLRAVACTVRGTVSGDRIVDGVLSAAVPRQVIQNQLIPWMASALDTIYNSASTDQSTRASIRTWFDDDGDHQITADELAKSIFFRFFLAGDVDVDCDGVKELSIGFGFTAVRAKIKP